MSERELRGGQRGAMKDNQFKLEESQMIRRHRKVKKSSLRYEVILDGAVRVMSDGRQICQENAKGRAEYKRRTEAMCEEQNWKCCICGRDMNSTQTFEHFNGRGASKRDDRIVDERGLPMNGAAHAMCNAERGSKRTAYVL